MICPFCHKEIEKDEEKYMMASDKPYFNAYFHKDCFNQLYQEDVIDWLRSDNNLQKILDNFRKKK